MFRPQFIHLIIKNVLGLLTIMFYCCKTVTELQPTSQLKKGVLVGEPLFKMEGKPIAQIEAPSWDDSLKVNNTKLRPQNTRDYNILINGNRYYGTVKLGNKQILINIPNPELPQRKPTSEKEQQLIFSWNPIIVTNQKLENDRIVVALFKSVIQVSNLKNEISNKEDIVWMGFGQKNKNAIDFNEGKMVEYDKISQKMVKIYNAKIENLSPGIYVWAIWAYNTDGTEIVAASREIPFRVSNI